jgi:outer membrane protein with beta-barrel domain
MRAAHYLFAATIAFVPAAAMAQSTPPATTTTPTQTYSTAGNNQWFGSAFVGSNFGSSTDFTNNLNDVTPNVQVDKGGSSLEFGGQIGYTWNRVVGAEFLADFTPSFGITNNLNLLSVDNTGIVDDPRVSTYMFNAIVAVPISAGRFQPYISGGLGGITAAADVLDNVLDVNGPTTRSSLTRLGTDIGGGVFTFPGSVGIRADVRYYHASSNNNTTLADVAADRLTENLLSGLSFWRANIGIAFRW